MLSAVSDGRAPLAHAVGYEHFWAYFFSVHQEVWTQRIHALATLFGLSCALVAFPMTLNSGWLFLAVAVCYPLAWLSHLLVERRWPAVFRNPFWALVCDLEMLGLLALSRIDAEAARLRLRPGSVPGARRLAWRVRCELAIFTYLAVLFFLEYHDLVVMRVPGLF